MSYIVKNGVAVAETSVEMKSGTEVRFGRQKTKNALDANREFDLVNAEFGVISNAKKHAKAQVELATELNPGEFLIA